jgi:hypothetical protein
MLQMTILDNILISQPSFSLHPLEDLTKAVHIYVGNFIQYGVEYKLTFSFYVNIEEHPVIHIHKNIVIMNADDFNRFITRQYQTTLSNLNEHWNLIDRIGYDPVSNT